MGDGRVFAAAVVSGFLLLSGALACSSKSGASHAAGGGAGADTGPGPDPGGTYSGPTTTYDNGMESVGQLTAAPDTKLPPLPTMTNVVALQGDDGSWITFDPVDGALDYRVYELPSDGDLTVAAGNSFTIKNGTYRCAGNREAPPVQADNDPAIGSQAIHTMVDQQTVGNFKRTLADATLGYVYVTPGDGRVPVYALGESSPDSDTSCFFGRYGATRVKTYTSSESERTQLLADRARDDGILFYVPAAADDTTTNVYSDEGAMNKDNHYYFPDGPEADAHSNKTVAFPVLTAAAPGTQPLMRVFYANECGRAHDELAVGKERFNRIYHQGDKLPLFQLTWTGYTAPTTLVVEALDSGCPFQGHLAPDSTPAFKAGTVNHQAWVTIDDARAASATHEVFINGQFDGTKLPKPIARSFINVTPKPHQKMDFFETFAPGSANETFNTVPCGTDNCYQTWRQQSPTYDQIFINAESGPPGSGTGLFSFGRILGEYWVSYADVAADTNGKFRMTANQKANLDSSTFLHVTMEADAYATARRYPQIIISTGDAPVQYALEKNHSLIIQPRAGIGSQYDYPVEYELQICNLRVWDVNNQCPVYDLHQIMNGKDVVSLTPNDEFGEHVSVDHRVLFDVFTSTDRTYLFLDGKPFGCAVLPPGIMPAGPVSVTWGDALYHSGVDHTLAFHTAHMLVEQRRHLDNLGFSSGVSAPTWDESRFPCAAPISL